MIALIRFGPWIAAGLTIAGLWFWNSVLENRAEVLADKLQAAEFALETQERVNTLNRDANKRAEEALRAIETSARTLSALRDRALSSSGDDDGPIAPVLLDVLKDLHSRGSVDDAAGVRE